MSPEWPANSVERWPLARLIPYARNARTHTSKQIKQIAASMQEWGWTIPVLADEGGMIIAGHARVSAAEINGYTEAPVMVARGWSEAKKRAYVIADNKLAMNAGWNEEMLGVELLQLRDTGFDMPAIGFGEAELDGLIREALLALGEEEAPEDIPEAPENPLTQPSDLWLLGRHRLLCGDATQRKDVEQVMAGARENAIVTDPPYGLGIINYASFHDSRENLAELVRNITPRLLEAPCAVLTPGVPNMWFYPQPAWVLAWIHPAPIGKCPWGFSGVNPILAYGDDPYLAAGLGSRPDFIVMAADRKGIDGHPTPKPFKVWRWLIERVAPSRGRVILDLFGGSGTTLIGCESLGHDARLIELAPAYCDVIIRRWQTYAGGLAVRERDGRTFDELDERAECGECPQAAGTDYARS